MQFIACSFLAALAQLAPAPPESDALLALVPADAVFVAHVPSARALHALRESNAWIGFVTDPEWGEFFEDVVLAVTGSEEKQATTGELWKHVLADSDEVVVFVTIRSDERAGGGLAIRGGDRVRAGLRDALGVRPTEMSAAGNPLSLVGDGDVYLERDDVVLFLSASEHADAVSVATEALALLDAAEPDCVLTRPDLRLLRAGASIEFAVNLDPVWPMLRENAPEKNEFMEEVFTGLSSMGWIYGKAVFGEGEALDVEISAPFATESILGKLFSFFGEADKGLWGRIPAGMLSASVFSFDVRGFADWAIGLLHDHAPDEYEAFEQGLEEIRESLGVDVMDDLVGRMTGQFVNLSPVPVVDSSLSAEEQMMQLESGVFVAMIEDADTIIESIEEVVEQSGVADMLVTSSFGGFRSWQTDVRSLGVDAALAVGSDALLLARGGASIDGFVALSAGEGKSILSQAKMAKALAGCSGAMVGVQDTRATFGMFDSALGPLLAGLESESPEDQAGLEILTRGMELLGTLGEQYFDGVTASTVDARDGVLRMVVRSR